MRVQALTLRLRRPSSTTKARSWVVVAALVGLAGSLVATWVTTTGDLGAIVVAPWLAMLAFEVGITAGAGLSLLATLAYAARSPIGPGGNELTWLGVTTRLAPLLTVGLGAAWIGSRLRLNEAAYRLLAEELPLATYIEAPDGASSYVGPQIEAMTGYPPADWLGGGLFPRVLHPSDRDRVLAAQEEARRAGEPLTHDYRIVTQADDVRWLREESVAVRGRDGRAIYRQGFVTDITKEKQAAERLQQEFVLRQALIDASIDAICLTTRDGELVLGNMPMARLAMELELPMQGPVQERLLSIADRMTEPDRYRETIRAIAADADTPRRDEFELRGTGRFFQGFASPVIEDGAFLGRIWTLREVTEERKLERQQLNFVASVSHELRTPLTSILGYADLLGEVLGPLETKPERYLAVIARNASRLQTLVDELLFVAQVDAGRFELDLVEVELAELAAASYEAALPLAEARSLELSLSIDARPTLTADPVRLGQAIDNLVSNAIKFTPDEGKVDIRVTATAGSAIFAVTDTGVGIPKSEQSRIGERFFRSSTAGELAIGGTGLGMAIVKMITDAHQGRVRLDSEPGRGTTVTLELPRQRA